MALLPLACKSMGQAQHRWKDKRIRTCKHTWTHPQMRARLPTKLRCRTHVHTFVHTQMHSQSKHVRMFVLVLGMVTEWCMHVRIHAQEMTAKCRRHKKHTQPPPARPLSRVIPTDAQACAFGTGAVCSRCNWRSCVSRASGFEHLGAGLHRVCVCLCVCVCIACGCTRACVHMHCTCVYMCAHACVCVTLLTA